MKHDANASNFSNTMRTKEFYVIPVDGLPETQTIL